MSHSFVHADAEQFFRSFRYVMSHSWTRAEIHGRRSGWQIRRTPDGNPHKRLCIPRLVLQRGKSLVTRCVSPLSSFYASCKRFCEHYRQARNCLRRRTRCHSGIWIGKSSGSSERLQRSRRTCNSVCAAHKFSSAEAELVTCLQDGLPCPSGSRIRDATSGSLVYRTVRRSWAFFSQSWTVCRDRFLYQMDHLGQKGYKPSPVLEKALDVLFLLHADHELNASCTTVLQTGSSLVDPYSAIASVALPILSALWWLTCTK